jgi:putative transposase
MKNDCWSMDFISDQLFTGEKLRKLRVSDNFSKLSIAIGVDYKYRACDV